MSPEATVCNVFVYFLTNVRKFSKQNSSGAKELEIKESFMASQKAVFSLFHLIFSKFYFQKPSFTTKIACIELQPLSLTREKGWKSEDCFGIKVYF